MWKSRVISTISIWFITPAFSSGTKASSLQSQSLALGLQVSVVHSAGSLLRSSAWPTGDGDWISYFSCCQDQIPDKIKKAKSFRIQLFTVEKAQHRGTAQLVSLNLQSWSRERKRLFFLWFLSRTPACWGGAAYIRGPSFLLRPFQTNSHERTQKCVSMRSQFSQADKEAVRPYYRDLLHFSSGTSWLLTGTWVSWRERVFLLHLQMSLGK